jgi:NAD(P)-dependent dehydrogenase (short-subunit alcohol dehydrogenase family)
MSDTGLALVTGGAQGIGYACAEALKADGYEVILSDVNADAVTEAAARLGAAAGIACDVADAEAVTAMFDRVEADHGPVAALVNNAGIAMPGDFLSYDLEAFDRVIAVNLRGTFVALQRAARTMVEKEDRRRHRQHVLDQRAARHSGDPGLLRLEGGRDAADQGGCTGARAPRHPGERGRPRARSTRR